MPKNRSYKDDWDEYVRNWRNYAEKEPDTGRVQTIVYPGDEWGNQAEWSAITDRRLRPYLPPDAQGVAIEIGSGAGKYAEALFDYVSKMICFDVSRSFMEVAAERLAQTKGPSDKVRFELLELKSCFELRDRATALGVAGKVDLVFSIAAMEHVELHTLMAYFINAGLILRPGGHLVMSVASCSNPQGFDRLLDEVAWVYGNERPSHQFYFLSKDAVRFSLERLGFDLVAIDEKRDITFVARKGEKAIDCLRRAEEALQPQWIETMRYESERAG